jgi:hypothetical protein
LQRVERRSIEGLFCNGLDAIKARPDSGYTDACARARIHRFSALFQWRSGFPLTMALYTGVLR